jgi:hypothetical protein
MVLHRNIVVQMDNGAKSLEDKNKIAIAYPSSNISSGLDRRFRKSAFVVLAS